MQHAMTRRGPRRPARVEAMFRLAALGAVTLLVVGSAGVAIGASVLGARGVHPGAQYEGNGVALSVGPDGTSVTIEELPIDLDCASSVPSNAGEIGIDLPLDGRRFSSGSKGSDRYIAGSFSANGKKVTGEVRERAFADPAKGFDCKAFRGTWSAKLVKGTGTAAGTVLARDDFSDPTSGFEEFNTATSYAEYLDDDRFRLGLRQAGSFVSLRAEPEAQDVVVEAEAVIFSKDPSDAAGLVCRATASDTYVGGFLQANGNAILAVFRDGAVVEPSRQVQVPGFDPTPSAQHDLRLACASETVGGRSAQLSFSVDGEEVLTLSHDPGVVGSTGVAAAGSSGATEVLYSDFVVRSP